MAVEALGMAWDAPTRTPVLPHREKGERMTKRTAYLSYLLRMWRTSDGSKHIWRASLEMPGSGKRQGFASLQDLFGFLQAQAAPHDESDLDDEQFQLMNRRKP